MSTIPHGNEEAESDTSSESWAEQHREELEREANSDLPHAWVAERILQSLDDEEGES